MKRIASIACVVFAVSASSIVADVCPWRPWAANWSRLNLSPFPPYFATNWDYTFGQNTVINMTKDVPPGTGSTVALHFFFDKQPPSIKHESWGSGGVYQQIAVQPGVPLQYSFWWKGKAVGPAQNAWFGFMLIDGPFTIYDADTRPDNNNPHMVRKIELINGEFGWQQLTDQSPPHVGPGGPRPQTITPTGSVVTVVLKAGCHPMFTDLGVEAFFDEVVVRQAGGPNLLVNGEFESQGPEDPCGREALYQDAGQGNYWFAVACTNPTTFTGVTPSSLANPSGAVQLTIKGQNVTALSSVSLEQADTKIPGTSLTPSGADLRATFDLTCVPEGPYRLVGTRADIGCTAPEPLEGAFRITKTRPAGGCAWQPWAAPWSSLNSKGDLYPDHGVHRPTNWDFLMNQDTLLGLPRDTPDGSATALHLFFADQATEPDSPAQSNDDGSGGVFQEIAVTPGVPLQYSFWWKGLAANPYNWFEVLLIDGPFDTYSADRFQESAARNNPAMVRKLELANASFGWAQLTDQSPADTGPAGPRPQTITPTGSVATIVLKLGHAPAVVPGGVEVLFDNIVVKQNNGPNLVVNGDFENAVQRAACRIQTVVQDPCDANYWRLSPYAPPLIDAVVPALGPNTGPLNVQIDGYGFQTGAAVRLVREGQPDIVATGVGVTGDTRITCTLDLTAAALGTWTLVVTNSDTMRDMVPFVVTCSIPGFSATSVTPDDVDNDGVKTLTIGGYGFSGGGTLQVALTLPGVPAIPATNIVVQDDTQLTCDVDLTGAVSGLWDVVVTHNDCSSRTSEVGVRLRITGEFTNGEFELPDTRPVNCGPPPAPLPGAPQGWSVDLLGGSVSRDGSVHAPPCPCPLSAGGHYASLASNTSALMFAYQTVRVQPGGRYRLSGYFAGGGESASRIALVDGSDHLAFPLAETTVHEFGTSWPAGWAFASVEAVAVSPVMTLVWYVETSPIPEEPWAAGHADGLAFGRPCAVPPQDTDGDGDVDLADFGMFQACFNGPNRPWPPPPLNQESCRCLDRDGDLDVDLSDFGAFQACFNGPNRPPACE